MFGNKKVLNILDKLFNNCKYKYDIDWHKVLSDTKQLYNIDINNYNYTNNITITKLKNILKKLNLTIQFQIIDKYNKIRRS